MKAKKLWAVAVATLILCVIPCKHTGAQRDDEKVMEEYLKMKKAALRGLQGVEVVVIGPGKDVAGHGLTASQMKTDVELRLRKAGISVLTHEERLETPGAPYLEATASVQKTRDAAVFLAIVRVRLMEWVHFARDLTILRCVPTWESEAAGTVGLLGPTHLQEVRRMTNDQVDEFVNDYLAANPKPYEGPDIGPQIEEWLKRKKSKDD